MSQDNVFVQLVKKSVGLPTGKSDCCGAPAESQSNSCCDSSGSSDCCGTPAESQSNAGCDSGNSNDCCGAETSQSSGCGCGGDCCGAGHTVETIETTQEK